MSTDNSGRSHRAIRSFVVRAGRMTDGQHAAIEQLWPRFGLDIEAGKLDQQSVFGRSAPLVVEIGFGMGDSLVAMALAHPEKDYVGIEVHPPGVGNIFKLADAAKLSNLKVYKADAKDVLQLCIADGQLQSIQIYFPDPWHKKKHNKRRLIQPDFVQELRPKLAVGGVLHLATDWEPYAEQMMEVMSAAAGFENSVGAGNWALEHDRPETKFQRRGEKLGHGVWDLLFVRVV